MPSRSTELRLQHGTALVSSKLKTKDTHEELGTLIVSWEGPIPI